MALRTSLWAVAERATTIAGTAAVVAIVIVLCARGWRFIQPDNNGEAVKRIRGTTDLTRHRLQVGKPRIALVEFSDFECPFCGAYARTTFAQITREFVDTGQLTYLFRNFPSPGHPNAIFASKQAECAAEQNKFWQVHEILFADLSSRLRPIVHQSLTIDKTAWDRCIASQAFSTIRRDLEEGQRLGIKSTPTFLLGRIMEDGQTISLRRQIIGAQSFLLFQQTIEDVLKVNELNVGTTP